MRILVLPGDAVDGAIADPATRTVDPGGRIGTRAFGRAVADALAT